MPFINESPFCYCYDLDHHIWTTHKLNLIDMAHIQPQITCASVIGNKIYLVGGRLLNSYILSNAVIEIDTDNFNTRIIKDAEGSPPRPRHEHSVDAIADRFLVVFGGLCYNSVGENDVYVYDKVDNRWFVPPVTGHLPHLRFGHASTAIGTDLYIHGGAQLDNDSSYIVYDDLYKLDCKEWVWYKYEHPEVERYLRNQDVSHGEPSSHREHLISTNGDSPYDRFQSYMCNYGHKLIIFGGHSIREDEDDNEILCSYSLDELCVFNVKRNAWSLFHASVMRDGPLEEEDSKKTEESLTVSDMSIAPVMLDGYGIRIYIFAGHKAAEVPRSSDQLMETDNSSHSFDSNHHSDQHHTTLPSITEQIQSDCDDVNSSNQSYKAEPKTIEQTDGLRFEDNDNRPISSDQVSMKV
ncbi:hypothetical protein EDC96DRAFT_433906 [Choanephora cucurbitarum]|nr:hypothetical protein EDC96DRAFT_433906 [Choanephora cucurbitarum]